MPTDQSKTGVKYYKYVPAGETEAVNVFRVFEDKNRLPERLDKNNNWVADDGVLLRLMSGELDDEDVISEQEASEIIEKFKK